MKFGSIKATAQFLECLPSSFESEINKFMNEANQVQMIQNRYFEYALLT